MLFDLSLNQWEHSKWRREATRLGIYDVIHNSRLHWTNDQDNDAVALIESKEFLWVSLRKYHKVFDLESVEFCQFGKFLWTQFKWKNYGTEKFAAEGKEEDECVIKIVWCASSSWNFKVLFNQSSGKLLDVRRFQLLASCCWCKQTVSWNKWTC